MKWSYNTLIIKKPQTANMYGLKVLFVHLSKQFTNLNGLKFPKIRFFKSNNIIVVIRRHMPIFTNQFLLYGALNQCLIEDKLKFNIRKVSRKVVTVRWSISGWQSVNPFVRFKI